MRSLFTPNVTPFRCVHIEIGAKQMNLSNSSRYALAVCAFVTVLTACNSGGPQVTPLGSMQRSAARFGIKEPRAAVVAPVVHDAHRVSPDRIVYTRADVFIENSQYNLDLNNDGTADFVISESNTQEKCGGKTDYRGAVSLIGQGSNGVEVSNGSASQLGSGSPIGPSQSFLTGSWPVEDAYVIWLIHCSKEIGNFYGNWPPPGGGYLGLAFVIGGKTHYGWAKLTDRFPQRGWLSAELTGYAYQTKAGKSIMAGQK